MQIAMIPIRKIRRPKFLLRLVDETAIEFLEMKDSIEDNGLLQPILVRPIGDDLYEVVEGNWRYTCCLQLELEELPCLIKNLDDAEVMMIQIEANAIRPETKPIEYAERLERIMKLNKDMSIRRLSLLIHKSSKWIDTILRLNKLIPELKIALQRGDICVSSASEAARLPKSLQSEVCGVIRGMPADEFKRLVGSHLKVFRESHQRGLMTKTIMRGYEPVPFLQHYSVLKKEYEKKTHAPSVLVKSNAQSPLDGWVAALAWVLHLDPDSVEAQKQALVVRWEEQERAIRKRREDRRRLRELRQNLNS